MKVFWAWQSDTPGKVGRHFVREALEKAVEQLREEVSLEEPERGERLHLDHDRKDVPGSPELARTILEKIDSSAVFIGDVTPVGKVSGGSKALINPNVAIEAGYALATLGDGAFLMVMNEAYGDRGDIPFDLRHRAGPICFNLAEGSGKERRQEVERELVGTLKAAIRACLTKRESETEPASHQEIPAVGSPAQFFPPGESLGKWPNGRNLVFSENGALLYLRLIPIRPSEPLSRTEVSAMARESGLMPLMPLVNIVGTTVVHVQNTYGAARVANPYQEEGDGEPSTSITQVFKNREMWGVDETHFYNKQLYAPDLEPIFARALLNYLTVARESLGLVCPLTIEAGAAGVGGYSYVIGEGGYRYPASFTIYESEIKCRQELLAFEEDHVNAVLLKIYETFFDAAGQARPPGFLGFPSEGDSS